MTNDLTPPPPTALPPSPQPASGATKGCSPGCKTAVSGCAWMSLGSFLTIAAQLALLAMGVSAISECFNANSGSGFPRRTRAETSAPPSDPADLGLKGTRRDVLLQKCGTPEEQTNDEVAAVCREERENIELEKRWERERQNEKPK